jgi:hypothetical protein
MEHMYHELSSVKTVEQSLWGATYQVDNPGAGGEARLVLANAK